MKSYKLSSPSSSNKPGLAFGQANGFGGGTWIGSGNGQPSNYTTGTNWKLPVQLPSTGISYRLGSTITGNVQRLASTPNQAAALKSGNISRAGFSGNKKKKASPAYNAHNILEPLVELRPVATTFKTEKPQTSTVKNLQAQLAKSHKKSQKLNLIRPNDPNNSYFPGFYEPTQAQILEAENRKNEALLQIYTDSGTFSKVVAMTVAASVLDTKLPYDVVQYPLDSRKKEELVKFCHDISSILGVPDMKSLDGNDYRRLWHLFSIFTNAMDQRICSDPRSSVPEPNASSNNNNSRNSFQSVIPRRKPEETVSDTEIIETIKTFNPTLYHALKDPLERFLIVYGRYVDVGQVNKSSNLKHNVLNEHISRYHERVSFNLPSQSSPFKHPNTNTMHNDRDKVVGNKTLNPETKNISATNSYLEKANQQHQQFQQHVQNLTLLPGINDNDSSPESRPSTGGSIGDNSWGTLNHSNNNFDEDGKENKHSKKDSDSSRHQSRHHKKNHQKKKKRGGPPSWVQAYHRCKTICLDGCRYDVVRRIALENGFKEVGEHDVWNIIWTDIPISLEKALEMRRFQNAHAIFWGTTPPVQKANHFPGMNEICRKDRLARNLNRMQKSFPEDYNFFPRTWSLPADVADLLMYSRLKKNATYICKPDSGCQGKGIFLARNLKKLNPFAKLICQVYIPKPLLIDGYKFDLRIYILITSCDPLRVFIYNEGIARFATVKYSQPNDANVDVIYMHLTNYSLNKFSQSYDTQNDGSKRKMSAVLKSLADMKYDVRKLQDSIDSVVVKTMIAAQPTLRHYYRASFPKHDHGSACFEILGFDILIDRTMKPYLLEVNHSPSFNLDLPVDAEIKEALLKDTFNIIFMGSATNDDRKSSNKGEKENQSSDNSGPELSTRLSKALQMQMHHENSHIGNFRLIYPLENSNDYGDFFDQTSCPTMADSTQSSRRRSTRTTKSKTSNNV